MPDDSPHDPLGSFDGPLIPIALLTGFLGACSALVTVAPSASFGYAHLLAFSIPMLDVSLVSCVLLARRGWAGRLFAVVVGLPVLMLLLDDFGRVLSILGGV